MRILRGQEAKLEPRKDFYKGSSSFLTVCRRSVKDPCLKYMKVDENLFCDQPILAEQSTFAVATEVAVAMALTRPKAQWTMNMQMNSRSHARQEGTAHPQQARMTAPKQ